VVIEMIRRFLRKRIGDVDWLFGFNVMLFLNAIWFYLYGSVYYFDDAFILLLASVIFFVFLIELVGDSLHLFFCTLRSSVLDRIYFIFQELMRLVVVMKSVLRVLFFFFLIYLRIRRRIVRLLCNFVIFENRFNFQKLQNLIFFQLLQG
jgi:hypothetical protein